MASKPKISFALKGSKPASSSKLASKAILSRAHKRQRSLSPSNQEELITGFDSTGVITAAEPEQPKENLVIPAVANKNWIEETKRKRGHYKPVGQIIDAERDRIANEQEKESLKKRSYGLNLVDKQHKRTEHASVVTEPSDAVVAVTETDAVVVDTAVEALQDGKHKQTAEERALGQLISEFTEDPEKKSDLVLQLAHSSSTFAPSEEEAYKADVESRPDEPTLEDYEHVPVEEFGLALLRGMGWKEGEGIGRNRKRVS
ncbi:DExH-box splicing factor binding site-domain-containing protein [Lipomyces arxii]|uniref:DExH-box splicing factor binding site-domain-containing protein n=1 Tax=Lipomyces arxii TaxID=56418 RepID=UPI0034CEDEA6